MNFKKFIGLQCNIELICQHLKMLLNILNAMSRGYGVMKKQILKIRALLLVFSITTLYSSAIFAQMPGISSSMLSEYNNMSSSQKRNLAEQYGINLNTLGLGASGDLSGDFSMESGSIGGNTKEIETDTNKVLYERIIEAQDYRQKAEERRRKNIPIFERDYTSLEELPIYGQFLFDGKYSTFAPMNNIPVPHNYVLGAGDSLRIDLFGSIDSTIDTKLNLTINRIGEINFPELGAMSLAGMTFSEAKEYIESRVSKQMIGVNLNVSIGRLKSINVFMAGESKIPGAYSVSGLSTVSQALFVAGGITNIGSLRDIQIKRSGKVIQTYDLYKLLSEGKTIGIRRIGEIRQGKRFLLTPGQFELRFADQSGGSVVILSGQLKRGNLSGENAKEEEEKSTRSSDGDYEFEAKDAWWLDQSEVRQALPVNELVR